MFTYKELSILKHSIEISTTSLINENKTFSNKIKKEPRDKTYYLQLIEDNNSKIIELSELGKKIDGLLA